MIYQHTFASPFKESLPALMAVEENGALIALYPSTAPVNDAPTALLAEVERQIDQYCHGERFVFDLPLAPKGSGFRKNVWEALLNIPFSETRSYEDIAASCGDINAVRTVGSAVGANPIMIIIPCHRVIRKNGNIGGYAYGTELKQILLEHEKKYKRGNLI